MRVATGLSRPRAKTSRAACGAAAPTDPGLTVENQKPPLLSVPHRPKPWNSRGSRRNAPAACEIVPRRSGCQISTSASARAHRPIKHPALDRDRARMSLGNDTWALNIGQREAEERPD